MVAWVRAWKDRRRRTYTLCEYEGAVVRRMSEWADCNEGTLLSEAIYQLYQKWSSEGWEEHAGRIFPIRNIEDDANDPRR